jgi:hypothetical protein
MALREARSSTEERSRFLIGYLGDIPTALMVRLLSGPESMGANNLGDSKESLPSF